MPRLAHLLPRRLGATAMSVALGTAAILSGSMLASPALAKHAATSSCSLGTNGSVQHVIYVQFDNTHFLRDIPNVPSDLEQMPHLLNFLQNNGTLLTNDHTILISHTAGGILSSITGVYPDRHGQTVSNSYVRYFGSGFSYPSSFGYWTDPVGAFAGAPYNMVTPTGANAPAPWVPFTRAGCDFGSIATANTVLENTGTSDSGDITKVFGSGSPQWMEAKASAAAPYGTAARQLAQTDFVGLAVHCAAGSATCAGGQNDVLPDEPGGYAGYKGLFGAQEVNPVIAGGSPVVDDTAGNPITDPYGQPGFPGFDGMSAAASLGYTAAMQEAGVPVTFAYISDAHDYHGVSGNAHDAYGPGAAGYVQQLKEYDDAFAAFFSRLAADGINKSNTLFVFTVDEGDHFVGGSPTPANCDGVTTPCDWTGQIGEINANIDTLMANQHPEITTGFTVHGDDAPTFYLSGNPTQTDPSTRAFERAAGSLTAVNPYTGATDQLMVRMADQAEMKLLHMYTSGDPGRNATFTFFGDPNYYITDYPASTCETCIQSPYAWNHGDIQSEIATTWLGFVGPGIRQLGQTGAIWTDHTDVRPTMLADLGLSDSYQGDGRAIAEILHPGWVPSTFQAHRATLLTLGHVYKQLNAPFGALGMASLRVSTAGVMSGDSTDDSAYTATDAQLNAWAAQRDALAAQIGGMLNGAEFGGLAISEGGARHLIAEANALIAEVEAAAS